MSKVVFDGVEVSGSSARLLALPISVQLGVRVREERQRRKWTLRELAHRAGLSAGQLHWIERGNPASLGAYAALAKALGLRPAFDLVDRRRSTNDRVGDEVHAAMGDLVVRAVRRPGVRVSLDEPYQHYQFAGRADVVAWSVDRRAMLHVENRTRFPNLQDAFGSYNAKRQWLARAIAARTGLPGGFASVTHVMACLWSSEVLRVLRAHTGSFSAICPDDPEAFARWWTSAEPVPGVHSCLVVLDPALKRRARTWVGLDDALSARPRYAGYAAAAQAVNER